MVSINYLVGEIKRRKIIFDKSELLKTIFEDVAKDIDSGKVPKYKLRIEMKKRLSETARVADALYKEYDCPLTFDFDNGKRREEIEEYNDSESNNDDYPDNNRRDLPGDEWKR